jgi:CheY-like chemotaxis protein
VIVTILLVEDSPDDVFFMKRALNRAGANVSVQVAEDGEAALQYLNGDGAFANRLEFPLPRLILLDLRMPRLPGFEVLKWVRSREEFDCTPVIVFSSSREDSDMKKAYSLGANAFLVKSGDSSQLLDMVKCMVEFWLKHNEAPRECVVEASAARAEIN